MIDKYQRALNALNNLNPGCPREKWIRIAMAAKAADLSFEDFHSWCQNAHNYAGEKDCRNVWGSIDKRGGITAATLFNLAQNQGWRDNTVSFVTQNSSAKNVIEIPSKSSNTTMVIDVWERCLPVDSVHKYISRKQGFSDGLRYYPETEIPLIINGVNVSGFLAVPCWSDDVLQTVQFVPPEVGKKLNIPGARFGDGYFRVGEIENVVYIVESIGNAWAVYRAQGSASVVCFSSGRMQRVSKVLRCKYPGIRLVIVPDRGKEEEAVEIAKDIDGELVRLPQSKPSNYDVNDYLIEHGKDALCDMLHDSRAELPMSVIFADELPASYMPADELIEDVLIAGDGSILYGDSNSGKTFLVIDLACAVARGIDWMGRKVEPGLVIYLAAESPSSVKRRLQAYQLYHKVRVDNFAIVQNPIDLFDGDADTNTLIRAIRLLEKRCGQKARLIIGDTLARLSAGANENAGQDMGLVVRHFDRIRTECNAHFMLIHHSGKNVAAGARGWSGIRAAVDTEIEVTESPVGRCAEITKQRDLSSKGQRIGFKLEVVTLGLTKWRSSATSCVVMPADVPQRASSKRMSEVGGAIIEYLRNFKNPIKKRELVKHFDGRYSSTSVYRELRKLVISGEATDSLGYVKFLVQTGAD